MSACCYNPLLPPAKCTPGKIMPNGSQSKETLLVSCLFKTSLEAIREHLAVSPHSLHLLHAAERAPRGLSLIPSAPCSHRMNYSSPPSRSQTGGNCNIKQNLILAWPRALSHELLAEVIAVGQWTPDRGLCEHVVRVTAPYARAGLDSGVGVASP